MDTITITRLALTDNKIAPIFGGVFPSDKLPNNRGKYRSFIVNTDPSFKRGEHWQAIYIDKMGKGTFFCSYGSSPNHNITNFLTNNSSSIECNPNVYQHPKTMTCGLFCLYFLWHITRGLTITKLIPLHVYENELIIQRFACNQLKTCTKIIHSIKCKQCSKPKYSS